uniref:Uncharacterized protein n=1 Tax=Anguilla anguilla TaxID=7936 RepID=A0A0E9XQ56_ANGAN
MFHEKMFFFRCKGVLFTLQEQTMATNLTKHLDENLISTLNKINIKTVLNSCGNHHFESFE